MPDAATDAQSDLGALPEWDLNDLYPGPDSPELQKDLDEAAQEARAFNERYKGKVSGLTGDALGDAIVEYEAQHDALGRIASFAQLLHAGSVSDPEVSRFFQNTTERVTDITADLLFFTLEINRIDDEALAGLLSAPKVAKYAPWIRDTRAFREHELSDDLERLFHDKRATGASSWMRLFDETMASLRFPIRGRDLTSEEALHLLTDKDRSLRADAAKSLRDTSQQSPR